MKFYVCEDAMGTSFDCYLTLKEAKRRVREDAPGGLVEMVDVPVSAESIQRLLTTKGGYANESRVVYEDKL